MKQTIAIFVMMVTMILYGSSVVYADCNNLTIKVTSSGWTIDDIDCTHGHVESSTDKVVVLSSTGGMHGPDCRIGFKNPTKDQYAIVEFQQNYCFLEAGDITVKSINGPKPDKIITGGSYADGKGGKVIISGFK